MKLFTEVLVKLNWSDRFGFFLLDHLAFWSTDFQAISGSFEPLHLGYSWIEYAKSGTINSLQRKKLYQATISEYGSIRCAMSMLFRKHGSTKKRCEIDR